MARIELYERFEIQDLLTRYCYAADDKDWLAFENLFADNAILDFSAFGGPCCGPKEMTEYLRKIAAIVPAWQHTISTNLLIADGEIIKSRTAAQVMMIAKVGEADHVSFIGLWYRDDIVRTINGWKIKKRVQEYSWVHNALKS